MKDGCKPARPLALNFDWEGETYRIRRDHLRSQERRVLRTIGASLTDEEATVIGRGGQT